MRAKLTPSLIAFALFAGLGLDTPAAAAEGWRVFSFPEAGFAVQLPQEPKPVRTTYGADAVPATVWSFERPGAVFSVTVADFTGKGLERDQAVEAAVQAWSRGGEVKLDVIARIDREFGRQLSLTRPDGARSTASFFFVRDKLYLLEGRLAADQLASADGARFQQSLELIGLGAEAFRPENRPAGGLGGGGGRPGSPPPQAFAACSGKAEGAKVSFTGPRGDVAASCVVSPRGLVARPDRPPPGLRPGGQRRFPQ